MMQNLLPISGWDKDRSIIISGPCSAESENQVLQTAHSLHAIGVKIFRAGIWKPRTKPGGFEGVGVPGLKWLQRVKKETGMRVITEVATPAHIEAALAHDLDMLWIGARTSSSPFAMQDIADTLRKMDIDVPVLVKNPVSPDLELWIGALERLYESGVRRLGAIHRGFTSYGESAYRNQPHWRVPLDLRIRYPQLPIICDPSHIGGKRELIQPLSQQALDMGFDGLIIESHCNPESALSDSEQQLTPEQLSNVLQNLIWRSKQGKPEALSVMRDDIDRLDGELLDILSRRMEVSKRIGEYKRCNNMAVIQPTRFDELQKRLIHIGMEMGMSEHFLRTVLSAIHEESVRHQVSK